MELNSIFNISKIMNCLLAVPDKSDRLPKWVIPVIIIFSLFLFAGTVLLVKYLSLKHASDNQEASQDANIATKKHGFLKFIFIVILLAVIIFGALKILDCATNKTNQDGATQPFSRTARRSDILIQEKNISFNPVGVNYALTSNVDISNLKVKVSVFNSSESIKAEKTFFIGDVKKTIEENFVYSISDLNISLSNLTDWLKNDFYWNYEVVGGTVSYFA